MSWRRRGSVRLSSSGETFRYVDIPTGPGVYRIRLNQDGEQRYCYIGQSTRFRERVAEDVRANAAEVREVLNAGGNVQVDRAEDLHFADDRGGAGPIDAARGEFVRLMIEGIAVGIESPNLGMLNRARSRP